LIAGGISWIFDIVAFGFGDKGSRGSEQVVIRAAVLKADRGMVFDNSGLNQPPSHCLTFANERLVFALPRLPDWIRTVYECDLEL